MFCVNKWASSLLYWHYFSFISSSTILAKNNLPSKGPLYAESTCDDDRQMGPIILIFSPVDNPLKHKNIN